MYNDELTALTHRWLSVPDLLSSAPCRVVRRERQLSEACARASQEQYASVRSPVYLTLSPCNGIPSYWKVTYFRACLKSFGKR